VPAQRRPYSFLELGAFLCFLWVEIDFSTPVDVEQTAMVPIYNRATFGWYFSKHKNFSGIFLKSGSFDGIEPIFPFS
jgi:hypothetical protein